MPAIRYVEPIPWDTEMEGEYPGQEAFTDLAPGVPMVFCWCPPGKTVKKGFWLARHLVSQRQWQAVMGSNPSTGGKGEAHPVDTVSWHDAQKFCRKVGLRLPSEREWEHACRAGGEGNYGIGGGGYLNAQMANFNGNHPDGEEGEALEWIYREKTLETGQFPANAWGLQDMHGQLWEWCKDRYDAEGSDRVLRGGGWFYNGWRAAAGIRSRFAPGDRDGHLGFRPCPSSTLVPAGGRGGTER